MKLNMGGMPYEKDESFIIVSLKKQDDSTIIHNLNNYPYPFEDESIEEIWASHIIEHLDNPIKFIEECHRILKKGCKLTIKVPYGVKGFGHIEHKYFFNEHTLMCFIDEESSCISEVKFSDIIIKIKRGVLMVWDKREIYYTLIK